MMQKDRMIAFVCTGNTCRSPMAEAIFNKMAEEKNLPVRAVSFGLAAVKGMPASRQSVEVCKEIGIDLSQKKANFVFNYNNIFRRLVYCGVCGGRMDFSTREGRKSLGSFCCLR